MDSFGRSFAGALALVAGSLVPFAADVARAAVFQVNSTLDGDDPNPNGICDAAPPAGICTLRAALRESQNQVFDDDILVPAGVIMISGSTIFLGGAGGHVTIQGAGHASTRIRNVPGRSGLFIEADGWLRIRDLSIEQFTTSGDGAAIRTFGYSSAERCAFVSNSAGLDGGSISGGDGAAIELIDVAFAYGHAGRHGGEIDLNGSSTLSCLRCIFEGASAADDGGAIYLDPNAGGVIADSLFAGNESQENGGAIAADIQGQRLRIVNSTFSGNRAWGSGGALFIPYGSVDVYSSTIVGNTADLDLDGIGDGGGAFFYVSAGSQLANSIVSGNASSVTISEGGLTLRWPEDCAGTVTSVGHNLIQNFFTGCGPGDNGCCLASGSAPIQADPLLQPLLYNGSSTRTHAIGPGSPALNAGDPSGCDDGEGSVLTLDQRGATRPAPGQGVCDLGAYEYGALLFGDDFDLWEWKWSAVAP